MFRFNPGELPYVFSESIIGFQWNRYYTNSGKPTSTQIEASKPAHSLWNLRVNVHKYIQLIYTDTTIEKLMFKQKQEFLNDYSHNTVLYIDISGIVFRAHNHIFMNFTHPPMKNFLWNKKKLLNRFTHYVIIHSTYTFIRIEILILFWSRFQKKRKRVHQSVLK